MTRKLATALTVVAAVYLFAGVAQAALLWDDAAAMASWRGKKTFFEQDAHYTLEVEVQYAVYAPGTYYGTDPSDGDEYVYAYEIFNTLNDESVEVAYFSVGVLLDSDVDNAGYDATVGAPGQAGGVAPGSTTESATSVKWSFIGDEVYYGDDSELLIFTSPNPPRWMSASVENGGLSDEDLLPSPVPEPTTLAMLALGGLAMTSGWAMRRRRMRR